MGMHRFLLGAIGLCLLLLGRSSTAQAQPQRAVDAPHVRVELLAKDAALSLGRESLLGLRFVLEPGWHVYWQNPGDSGQAPSVRWTVRAGDRKAAAAAGDLSQLVRVGALRWPAPKRLQTGPLVNFGYEGDVVLVAPLVLSEPPEPSDLSAGKKRGLPKSLEVTADVSWLVCSEPCIPGRATLVLQVPVASSNQAGLSTDTERAALFAAAEAALPKPLPSAMQASALLGAQAFHVRVDVDAAFAATSARRAQFFPLQADVLELGAEAPSTWAGRTLSLRLPRSEQLRTPPPTLTGLLQLTADGLAAQTYSVAIPVRVEAEPAAQAALSSPASLRPIDVARPSSPGTPPQTQSLGWMLLFALLGGALLNLMPCVFPVLSIKALELVQIATADRRRARLQGAAYTAGVLVSFWLLAGLLIALRLTGQRLGWGFHLQSPRFLIALSALLFLMGLNLLGVFELGLGLTQLGQVSADVAQRRGEGLLSAFVTGVLATLVATPCTAPFMSTALGFALTQPPLVSLPIFTALGLGLALPYVLLSWLPIVRRVLPRPGAWMETFKQLMGFLLLGTIVWLSWILAVQASGMGVVALLVCLLIVGVAAWILHRWPHSMRAVSASVLLVLVGASAPAWLPGFPSESSPLPVASSSIQPSAGRAPSHGEPPPLSWVPYSKERLAAYRQAGTPVLVDFTAEWCVSCKVNERLVLQSAAVRRHLHDRGIVTMKADWTRYDPQITEALAEFGKSAIPFCALYGRDPTRVPIELPTILTPRIVLSAIEQIAPPAGATP